MIYKYSDFLLNEEFNSIFFNNSLISENNGKWIDDNTYQWDIKKENYLKQFLKKIPKKKMKKYFYKFLEKLGDINTKNKKRILVSVSVIFLIFAPLDYFLPNGEVDKEISNRDIKSDILKDLKELEKQKAERIRAEKERIRMNKRANFKDAQKIVKEVEKGYSDDKKDRGNYIKTKNGKYFIGTNHGISAPVLMEFLDRLPSKKDMINLTYQNALKIFKTKYWNRQNLDEVRNQSIANIIYDGGVNHGIRGMRNILRKALQNNNIPIKNNENPYDKKFLSLMNDSNPKDIFNSIKTEREKRYRNSITFKKHGDGWLNRLKNIKYQDN